MPSVAINCKASISDGMGHIYRQINLANELKKQGWEVSFYIPNFGPAIDLLTHAEFTSVIMDPESSIAEYLDKFFDFVILDIQNTTESLVSSVKTCTRYIASFEDLGAGRNHVDILIDSNLAPSETKNLPSSTRGLLGPDYSVLHPDFAYYHTQSRHFMTSSKSVLISMGATDPKNLTVPLTSFLLQEKHDLKLTVLIGHNTNIKPELNKLSNQFQLLNVLGPVSNMAQILWEHDAVICSGGVTLHEAMAVGTPAFVVNQVAHQQTKARFVEKSGAAINLGIGAQYDVKKIREALNFGKRKLESMSLQAKQLIDGQGVFRVINAMNKLIKI
jgi:spore coat polysaccharide biosynthesis predicted glycosyltransferase SpsG